VALAPQSPLPNFSAPAPPAPSAFWVGVATLGIAIISTLGAIVNAIAARWRGIVIAHLFFLTLWMAVQVFFFATGAYWCLPSNGSPIVEWLSKYFTEIARCGSTLHRSTAFGGSSAAAAPAPPPTSIPPPSPRGPSAGALPPPASASPGNAPAGFGLGAGSAWSSRGIANCWRDRSVGSGDCYETAERRRSSPPVVRYYRYHDPPPPRPCRRAYDCWPDDNFFPGDGL
jgi:hypothetical protein